jgi:hypothetical protein
VSELVWIQHDGGNGPVKLNRLGEVAHDPLVTVRIRAIKSRNQVLEKGNRYRASSLRWRWEPRPLPGDIMEYVIVG